MTEQKTIQEKYCEYKVKMNAIPVSLYQFWSDHYNALTEQ